MRRSGSGAVLRDAIALLLLGCSSCLAQAETGDRPSPEECGSICIELEDRVYHVREEWSAELGECKHSYELCGDGTCHDELGCGEP